MNEFFDRYYPTICIRRAEMTAMEKLPLSEKQKMLPIVLLAPWLNSIRFENTFERLSHSVGEIPIIVDLDRFYQSSSDLESRRYFRSLLWGEKSTELWIDLIRTHQNFIPTVQFHDKSEDSISHQIDTFNRLQRGVAFRFEIGSNSYFSVLKDHIDLIDFENTVFILDGGWSDYNQITEARLGAAIELITGLSEKARIVMCTSSFPNDFTELDNMRSVDISARQFYASIKRRYGNYQIYYGDWASTKPRRYDGGGSRPLARIDFPLKDRWVIARSKDEQWNFAEAAVRITRLAEWEDRPRIWGTTMIEKAASNEPGAITTGPQAIAARVNIHLFMQNNYLADSVSQIVTDSPWQDPI